MDKATKLANAFAQAAALYLQEVQRLAKARGLSDKEAHEQVRNQLDENERIRLDNALYFASLQSNG